MRRNDSSGTSGSLALLEDRKLLDDIWEMSSVIIDHYSLVKLTATEVLHITEEVRHKSNQLQTLLRISEQQLGRNRENYYLIKKLTKFFLQFQMSNFKIIYLQQVMLSSSIYPPLTRSLTSSNYAMKYCRSN